MNIARALDNMKRETFKAWERTYRNADALERYQREAQRGNGWHVYSDSKSGITAVKL